MHDLVEHTLSPLIQLIFVIAILAMMADARPETVIKMVLDAVVSIVETAIKSAAKIFEIIFNILRLLCAKKGSGSDKTPKKPGPGRKPKQPLSDIKLVEVEVLPPS